MLEVTADMTLFSVPVSWSRSAVGSTDRFLFMAGFHVFMGIVLVVFGGERVVTTCPIMLLTACPIMYLYAMKRLLQELDVKH